MHVGIFDLEHFKVIWGHSVHFSENLGRNSKTARRRAKQTKTWAPGVYGWMNQAYSRLSTTDGHITDSMLLVCMYWIRLVLVRPVASLYSASPLKHHPTGKQWCPNPDHYSDSKPARPSLTRVLSAKQSSRTSNFNVLCLTRPGIEPPTSRMPGERRRKGHCSLQQPSSEHAGITVPGVPGFLGHFTSSENQPFSVYIEIVHVKMLTTDFALAEANDSCVFHNGPHIQSVRRHWLWETWWNMDNNVNNGLSLFRILHVHERGHVMTVLPRTDISVQWSYICRRESSKRGTKHWHHYSWHLMSIEERNN